MHIGANGSDGYIFGISYHITAIGLPQQQRHIEAQQKPQQEDPTKKLQKYSDLRQKGLLTEEEFQKLKAGLLSQM
jgi:hypothetical protein